MSHYHEHHHGSVHSHEGEHAGTLSFEEKLAKLLEHWIRHNAEHEKTYRGWAEQAGANGQAGVGECLGAAVELTAAVNRRFEEALGKLRGK